MWELNSLDTVLIKLPDQEESISNVLISLAHVPIHYAMHNLSNLIDKEHNSFLEHLCGICETSNVAESKHGNGLSARQHGIYILAFAHIF